MNTRVFDQPKHRAAIEQLVEIVRAPSIFSIDSKGLDTRRTWSIVSLLLRVTNRRYLKDVKGRLVFSFFETARGSNERSSIDYPSRGECIFNRAFDILNRSSFSEIKNALSYNRIWKRVKFKFQIRRR